MAIRMQQRRGSDTQWTTANTVLAAGEIGFDATENTFRIGDGVNHWLDLPFYIHHDAITSAISSAVSAEVTNRNTAIQDATDSLTSSFTTSIEAEQTAREDAISQEVTDRNTAIVSGINAEVSNRNTAIASAITTEVSNRNTAIDTNIASFNTATVQPNIATAKSEAISTAGTNADTKVSTHNSATTNVHGIANTSNLVTKAGTETLTNKTISAADNTVTINLADVIDVTATVAEVNKLAGLATTKTELGYVSGVTSAIQTQIDTKAAKANPTFTGTVTAADISISGNLTVGGTTTTVNATNLEITDPLIYIATGNAANANDIGLVGHATVSGTYNHMGLVRDHADGKWKLFSGVTTEPTNVIAFSDATAVYDTLKVGGVDFSDGTQTKQGTPSLTTINQQTASYTPVLTDRDKLVEINSASAVTLTIPTNASVAYPVGTSFDILQTGAGQITIAPASGVTVNSTPGLKLRTQWSSATLFKRASDTWVVFGDLSA
jgi:hypothetical protein